jgi:hypothetical protein
MKVLLNLSNSCGVFHHISGLHRMLSVLPDTSNKSEAAKKDVDGS